MAIMAIRYSVMQFLKRTIGPSLHNTIVIQAGGRRSR